MLESQIVSPSGSLSFVKRESNSAVSSFTLRVSLTATGGSFCAMTYRLNVVLSVRLELSVTLTVTLTTPD